MHDGRPRGPLFTKRSSFRKHCDICLEDIATMAVEGSYMAINYVVFVAYIVASFVIPLRKKFCSKKKETKADYVFATGSVSMAAMMMSIARGTLGVRSFLGYPSELYYRGSAMWETLWGMLLAYPIVCFVFVPVYYSLGITSVYQYLDMRFKSRLVRCLASFSYVIRSLLNLAVTVFTPCVALKTVIGLPYWASIFAITSISVTFNLMGGLKAAIISDVIQGMTMIAISLAIILQGVFDVGSVSKIVNVNQERGRLGFFNFDMDPTIRVNTVSALVGQLFMSLSIFGCQQNFVQRYCSMSSQSKVVKTMMMNMPVITVLFSLSWIVGMVIFASYANCDPLSLGYISKIDEIVPFYIEESFVYLPGLLGLVMATLFNGSLSLTVSNLNSLATVTWEDFFSQIPALSDLRDRQQLRIIKFIGIIYGFLIMGASFLVGMLPGVIESSMLMTSATSGPLLGVFLLAMLVPCANWKGASAGMICSHAITLWITFGGLTVTKPIEMLPLSTDGCRNDSFSSYMSMRPDFGINLPPRITRDMTPAPETEVASGITYLYSITYMYYALIGSFTTVFVGIVISLLTADTKQDAYAEHLLHPFILKLSRLLPGRPRLYASGTRLDKTEQNGTATSNPNFVGNDEDPSSIGATMSNGVGEDCCKADIDCTYVKKLNALKGVSLEVANEITNSTKL